MIFAAQLVKRGDVCAVEEQQHLQQQLQQLRNAKTAFRCTEEEEDEARKGKCQRRTDIAFLGLDCVVCVPSLVVDEIEQYECLVKT